MKNAIQIKNNENLLSEIKEEIEKKDNILTTITKIIGQRERIKEDTLYFVGTYSDGKETIEIEKKIQEIDELFSPWMVFAYEFSLSEKTYWVEIKMEELINKKNNKKNIITSIITTLLILGGLFYFLTKADEFVTAEEKRYVLRETMFKKIKDFKEHFPQYEIELELKKENSISLNIVTISNPNERSIDMKAVKEYFGMTKVDNSEIIGDFYIQIALY